MKEIPKTDVYVRFCETDAGGHVNNTSYFLYMEEARTKFFETVGYGPQNRTIHFIVAHTACDFIAQAFAGQTLSIQSTVAKIGTKSYTMAHEIKDAKSGELIAKGNAVIVCFNFETQETEPIPPSLLRKLEGHYRAVVDGVEEGVNKYEHFTS